MYKPISRPPVAEDNSRIIRLLSCSIRPNFYHAANTCMIEDLIINHDYHGKRIGSLIIQQAVEIAKNNHCAEISVSTVSENLAA